MKELLTTGQLRHQIIKDHLKKRDLNLRSIDFNKHFKIKDVLNGKQDLNIVYESSKRAIKIPKAKTPHLRNSCQNVVNIYKQFDPKFKQAQKANPTMLSFNAATLASSIQRKDTTKTASESLRD